VARVLLGSEETYTRVISRSVIRSTSMNNPDKNDIGDDENGARPERPARNPTQKPASPPEATNEAPPDVERPIPRAPMPTERERERAENEGMPSIKPDEESARS
jgi:hypothetical protein